ncbi:hypothetical protein RIF29_28389 [Crotalaria pallida]|uniref:START domain-containing protein n=1 Tax=Crotalaria pallida TaxID=3830 RepID=A0AAN9EEP9_CROPI
MSESNRIVWYGMEGRRELRFESTYSWSCLVCCVVITMPMMMMMMMSVFNSNSYATLVVILLLPMLLLLLLWQRHKSSSSSSPSATPLHPITRRSSKLVTDSDLKFLKDILELEEDDNGRGDPNPNSNPNPKWEHVIHKTNHLLSYSAKCSKPKNGPLRYLSTTIFNDFSSAELLRNFYLDNDYRKRWDNTLLDHHQLHLHDNDNDASESEGVELGRTIKKFPLLKPREYVLAWKLWEARDNTFYCFIKECENPLAPRQRKYVRVEFFRSGWRIRKVPGRNACEIMMFHQEDAGLNMDMAKLAFSKGIWNYVCKMDNALRRYSVVGSHLSSSVTTSVNLMQKVPAWLDPITSNNISLAHPTTQVSDESQAQMMSSRPSKKKLLANSLLLVGGVICLSRGHSSLGAKVAMAYLLTKLNKRRAKPNQTDQS